MKARITYDCPIGRFKSGEVGILLPNDSDKYDHKIKLEPTHVDFGDNSFLSDIKQAARIYYFYEDEITILNA